MFPNLRAEMVRSGLVVSDIARAIHKTDKSVRSKLNGMGEFTLGEVVSIRDQLFPGMELDFLFEREDKKKSLPKEI